eukprot:2779365-Pyramimonas_sp.AAC.1
MPNFQSHRRPNVASPKPCGSAAAAVAKGYSSAAPCVPEQHVQTDAPADIADDMRDVLRLDTYMAAPAADPSVQPLADPSAHAHPPTPAEQDIQEPQSGIDWWKIARDCKQQHFEPLAKDLAPGTWDRTSRCSGAPRRGGDHAVR